ncbi:MAG: hypothetical protein FWG66_16000 [Spirochaetes bacterium]|nr:hypothetical protein [Spirochaetota bacterium]
MRVRQRHIILSVAFFVLILASCGRRQDERSIMPPASFPLSRDYVGYGVVSASFIHIMEEPVGSSESLGILRRGTSVRIVERRIIGQQAWLKIEAEQNGWVTEEVMEIFYSEGRARTAAQIMNR